MGLPTISDRLKVHAGRDVPQVGRRVRQAGTDRVYVVVSVDVSRRLADVRPLTGPARTEAKVPFECLRELCRQGTVPSPQS